MQHAVNWVKSIAYQSVLFFFRHASPKSVTDFDFLIGAFIFELFKLTTVTASCVHYAGGL